MKSKSNAGNAGNAEKFNAVLLRSAKIGHS